MSIYPSTKVAPYVYWLTHKETGQFYIGYREANKVPSDQDLPIYKTSSKKIAELGFENFDWYIIAEFFTGNDAYDNEQRLIEQHIKNPNCLNNHYQKNGNLKFSMMNKHHTNETKLKLSITNKGKTSNRKGKTLSKETKLKISLANKGKTISEETKIKRSISRKCKPLSTETKIKISISRKGRNNRIGLKLSKETKLKISLANKGKNSRIGTHQSEETKLKLSNILKGRIFSNETKLKMSISAKERIRKTKGIIHLLPDSELQE